MTADLRALDHEVWLDQDLGGGQDWWDEILARIRWCDAFVPVLSAASLGSRACTGERTYALALQRPVLPIAVGDLGPEGLLDEDLARRQRIAYRPADKPSTLRLLAAVHRLAAARRYRASSQPDRRADGVLRGAAGRAGRYRDHRLRPAARPSRAADAGDRGHGPASGGRRARADLPAPSGDRGPRGAAAHRPSGTAEGRDQRQAPGGRRARPDRPAREPPTREDVACRARDDPVGTVAADAGPAERGRRRRRLGRPRSQDH